MHMESRAEPGAKASSSCSNPIEARYRLPQCAEFRARATQEIGLRTNRRRLLRNLAGLAAASAVRKAIAAPSMQHTMSAALPEPLLDTSRLARWVDPLPSLPVLPVTGHRPDPQHPQTLIPYYREAMQQFSAKVHRDASPTTFWGYNASSPGPTIEARSGEPVLVEWVNSLPNTHLFPVDH